MIAVLDYGSQFSRVIVRRIRQLNVLAEIYPNNITVKQLADLKPEGIILSGGPRSVYEPHAPQLDPKMLQLGIPILGVCYGMQLIVRVLGGSVTPSHTGEYGFAQLNCNQDSIIFSAIPSPSTVWMSHRDRVAELPSNYRIIATTTDVPIAAIASNDNRIFGVQFHPEVQHTEHGMDMLKHFIFDVCHAKPTWNMANFITHQIAELKAQINDDKVILGLSGGVDSSVAAALLGEAIGHNLIAILVDHGLMRKNEVAQIKQVFEPRLGTSFNVVDASQKFFNELAGVADPEKKRKIIGKEFISVFESEARKYGNLKYLAQGTIYPDRIESAGIGFGTAVIKSHHNVGGLPKDLGLKVIEPLKDLFKDEVREVGRQLGLPATIIDRHPFPGPGLAIRIIGEVTPEAVQLVQEADAIMIEELTVANQMSEISQALCVLLPIKTVGVMGDDRSYERVIALRAVKTSDFMTADWSRIPFEVLNRISNRIVNEIKGINRVVYDITTKPPATIEWE